MTLLQTNNAEHEQAKDDKARYAGEWTREFVGDAQCKADMVKLGGAVLLHKHQTMLRPAHRADLWRYVRLFETGGYYMDIKMATGNIDH